MSMSVTWNGQAVAFFLYFTGDFLASYRSTLCSIAPNMLFPLNVLHLDTNDIAEPQKWRL